MNSEQIIKKLGKKQRLLLKVLVTRDIGPEEDENARLDKIATGLRAKGIVESASLSLTAGGRAFVFRHQNIIFDGIHLNDREILDKLLLTRYAATPFILKKRGRLFLIFLSEKPVNIITIRGAKHLIPQLREQGYVDGSEEIHLTEKGFAAVRAYDPSDEDRKEAYARFYASSRLERKAEIESKAEVFMSLYRHGSTYEEIGRLHNISRERVRQILNCSPRFSELLAEHKEAKKALKRQQEISVEKASRLTKLEKSLANRFPDHVDKLWDHEKNSGIDPTRIASRSASVEVWWKCPIDGHSWKRKPSEIAVSWVRSKKSGCPVCAGKKNKPVKQPTLMKKFPQMIRDYWDYAKNDRNGIFPDQLTLGSNRVAHFKCPFDFHEWSGKIHSVVKQQWSRGNAGCHICNGTDSGKKTQWEKAGKLFDLYAEQIAAYWMFERNEANGIDLHEVTIGSSKEAWFKCDRGGHIWAARIAAVRRSWDNERSGCPFCYRPSLLNGIDKH